MSSVPPPDRFYVLAHSGYMAMNVGRTKLLESVEYMVLDRDYNHTVVFSRIAPVQSMGPRFTQLRRARLAAEAKCAELNTWAATA